MHEHNRTDQSASHRKGGSLDSSQLDCTAIEAKKCALGGSSPGHVLPVAAFPVVMVTAFYHSLLGKKLGQF